MRNVLSLIPLRLCDKSGYYESGEAPTEMTVPLPGDLKISSSDDVTLYHLSNNTTIY